MKKIKNVTEVFMKILFLMFFALPIIAAASTKERLNKIMHYDMIGVQRAYFETIAGVAKQVTKNNRNYDVGGCQILITEDKDQNITSIELLKLSGKCTFNSANILLEGPAHQLTFGHLYTTGYSNQAVESCFTLCGNAADPTYGIFVSAPRSKLFLVFYAEITWSKRTETAILKLRENLERNHPNIDLSGSYIGRDISQKQYDAAWIEAFRNTRIDQIRFGYHL